jgi:hypothetical protein
LTQLCSVCSTTPKLRAAPAKRWLDSTNRTAPCLNSSVYLARFAFSLSFSLLLILSLWDTSYAGKAS